MSSSDFEGSLYVEISKIWEEMYCVVHGKKFQAFKKIRPNIAASKSNKAELSIEFDILVNECDCKIIKYGLAELSKLMKNSKLNETPYFFSVTASNITYKLAASTEDDRSKWIITLKSLARAKDRKSDAWIATGFLEGNYPPGDTVNRFGNNPNSPQGGGIGGATNMMLPSQRAGLKVDKPNEALQNSSPLGARRPSQITGRRNSSDSPAAVKQRKEMDDLQQFSEALAATSGKDGGVAETAGPSNSLNRFNLDTAEDEDEGEANSTWLCCCRTRDNVLGVKLDTIIRLLEVCSAFPFVIVVSALNLSNTYTFLRSVTVIRIMNIFIYVAPTVYVHFLLSQYHNIAIQRLAIGFYILLYLWPVAYVVFSKVQVSTSTSKIEEGTFCFKPARTVRVTQANFYALFGFAMEWLQHVLYVLPVGIVTSNKQTKLSDFPPYLSFEVYFWLTIAAVFICGLIIVLNAVLKGKLHYKFQSSYLVWFFLYNVGSPMFVTIVTILFMSLWCDYSTHPASLIQQPSIECYGDKHIVMARAALVAVAMYIIQHTLLPSGTFKETMRDNDLEIMFVPVYLQAHYLLKTVFCGVYVYFYEDNLVRVVILTFINVLLLTLNNFMKPCSVTWVNLLRDTFFIHATLSGIQSLNYLAWPINISTKDMVISTLTSNIIFSAIGMYVYYLYTTKSTEYTIATAFLDLEWQVSRGGSVHPRVLEPLISLTLSTEKDDWEIAKKYIGQLVWLISYPNMRVQFQSAWGLANLALLDDDARTKIHEAGGTKTLFEWYMDMEFVVQLEALAAMANLTLSIEVAEEMVTRYKCIPFFIDLVSSNKLKHAQFSAIALSNLARKEAFRDLIRRSGGITALVGCIMSHDYQKRRHGCRALANMALSPSKEIEQVFESKGLIDKILKMALRKEIETQREVVALIRNLACHARLRPMLLDRGVMSAVTASRMSVFEDVLVWCDEITTLLEREISGGAIDLKALIRREGAKGTAIGEADVDLLKKMDPLKGQVEWSTWGSKLESIFSPVFSSVPNLVSSQWSTTTSTPLEVFLPGGVSKSALLKARDSLSYVVLERPIHGKLNEYTTLSDYLTYTPNDGFSGTDFFTYRMQLGAINTATVTIAIVVEDGDDYGEEEGDGGDDQEENEGEDDIERGGGRQSTSKQQRGGKRGRKKSNKSNFEIEGQEQQQRRPGRVKGRGSASGGEENGGETNGRSRRPVSASSHTPFLQGLMKKMSLNGRDSPKPQQQQNNNEEMSAGDEERGSE